SKTDIIDARKLGELLRSNLLPTIWVPDLDTRRRRQLLRGRAFLVRERTRIKNRIHGHPQIQNRARDESTPAKLLSAPSRPIVANGVR
ncbi:MAG TPA: transposase, partial [Gemmatimonadaceae bacterium]|nr:transposase [Gemmatimonadaceae bacterium]